MGSFLRGFPRVYLRVSPKLTVSKTYALATTSIELVLAFHKMSCIKFFSITVFSVFCFSVHSFGQLTLTGSSYTQDFNGIGSGLPTGWTVSTSATSSAIGTGASFTSAATDWNSASSGVWFRNTSSSDIAYNSSSGTQTANANRALGWRPLTASARNGAVTLEIANTANFTNFEISVTVFQSNDVSGSQNYQWEYRVGSSGDFNAIGAQFVTNSTGLTDFQSTGYSFNSSTLAAIADQNDSVYIRFRGLTPAGDSGDRDTIGIDNFSMTYAAVPEPSTYALLAGVGALGFAFWRRRTRS